MVHTIDNVAHTIDYVVHTIDYVVHIIDFGCEVSPFLARVVGTLASRVCMHDPDVSAASARFKLQDLKKVETAASESLAKKTDDDEVIFFARDSSWCFFYCVRAHVRVFDGARGRVWG